LGARFICKYTPKSYQKNTFYKNHQPTVETPFSWGIGAVGRTNWSVNTPKNCPPNDRHSKNYFNRMNGIQIFKYFSSFLNVAHSGSKQMGFRKIFADFLT